MIKLIELVKSENTTTLKRLSMYLEMSVFIRQTTLLVIVLRLVVHCSCKSFVLAAILTLLYYLYVYMLMGHNGFLFNNNKK